MDAATAGNKEREAAQLLAEAEKRVKASQSFLRGLFGGNTKLEEACEMYTRAANMFKIAKNWTAAGNAFCQAAKLHMQLQSKHDSATCFVDAGNAYKKADPQGEKHCCLFLLGEARWLALEKYEEMFPAFTDSRECKLLKKLLEAHEEQNCEAYTEAVKEFDSISRLDQWLTTMLLRIKKSIQGEGEGDLK
ncbi:beta-soluble NSF attachment protein-like [Sphaerodactylus townsendi]|nr:beta-soluble NSF attachment protein-like [Sphaerodactylus townsendi]